MMINKTQKKKIPPAPRWNLETIFRGGSDSKEFADFRKKIKDNLNSIKSEFANLPKTLDDSDRAEWIGLIVKLQDIIEHISEGLSFAHCLVSQNVKDEKAHQLEAEMDVYNSEFEKLMVELEAFSKNQSDEEWEKLLESEQLKDSAYFLNETRRIAREKMEPEIEAFATEMAVNGYHAWNRLYDKMYGDLSEEFTEDGETKRLSLGQLANKMAVPDRSLRKQAHEKIEKAWERRADLAAMVLNFQAGFRLTLYGRRKWASALYEPLLNNHMKQETLDAMWSAVVKGTPRLMPYINAKKKILGIDKFCWYDQFAPVGKSERTYSFDESGRFIIENFKRFNPAMAEFGRMALDNNWVEAEDRPGKAGGGYCTHLDLSKQSRIFMTYSGSFSELATLAHELGHAYHGEVIKNLPTFARFYPMTLAETASIFNELLVKDAAFENSDDADEKLMLLDQKLQDVHILFCNIYARYLFDKAFYEERKKGMVSRTRLDEMMIAAQKEAFGETIDTDEGLHPLFWASKLHFYLTDAPFYNFPYTFGFLFANGVYSRAQKEGTAFVDKYIALLSDTGRMSSEDVAKKHLGVDLTKEDFWNESVELALADVDPFVKLAAQAG